MLVLWFLKSVVAEVNLLLWAFMRSILKRLFQQKFIPLMTSTDRDLIDPIYFESKTFFPKDPVNDGSSHSDVPMCWALHWKHQDNHSRGKVGWSSPFPHPIAAFQNLSFSLSVVLQKLEQQGFYIHLSLTSIHVVIMVLLNLTTGHSFRQCNSFTFQSGQYVDSRCAYI